MQREPAGWRRSATMPMTAALRLNRHVNARARSASATRTGRCRRVPQAQGQERGQLHRRLRGGAGASRRAAAACDGVICGHIHQRRDPRRSTASLYCNDGDWVESCTTLVEDFAGRLSLLRWTETAEVLAGAHALPLMDGVPALEHAA
ncbi:MAG: hypothetical protein MZW92_78605 [Comamonadaceae bacterium]|nr:hypothetical protein [Comamonadaceae bacterium]